MRGKVPERPIVTYPLLPLIVDLHKIKPERFELFGRRCSQFLDMLFIASAGILLRIPGTKTGGLARKLDRIGRGDGIGIRLQTKPCVFKITQSEGFAGGILSRRNAKASVIDLRLQPRASFLDRRTDYTASAIFGNPTAHHTRPRSGVHQSEKRVAAGICRRRQQTARAQSAQIRDWFPKFHRCRNGRQTLNRQRVRAAIVQCRCKKYERRAWIKRNRVAVAVRVIHLNPLARFRSEPFIGDFDESGFPAGSGQFTIGDKCLARRLRLNTESGTVRFVGKLVKAVFQAVWRLGAHPTEGAKQQGAAYACGD